MVNRLMRMQKVVYGNAEDELHWAEAMNVALGDYYGEFSTNKEKALADMAESVDHLGAGSQWEMNLYCYVLASIEYFRTIDAYLDLRKDLKDEVMRGLLEVRRAVSKALPAARRKAYDRLTADYHWEIVNDDDGVGLEID